MRFKELLKEDIPTDISAIKKDIIGQVQSTNDPVLLHKIYTALHSTGLTHRIRGALSHVNDAKTYIDEIIKIIINTEGTVQVKQEFAEGLSKGYIDLDKMTSGRRVHFEDLIKINEICKDRKFLLDVFQSLKNVGREQQKGSGEFAIAVFSPQVTIAGAGDLKIGDKTIEVKASAGEKESSGGGRMGSTGDIGHNVSGIFAKYFGSEFVNQYPNINLNQFTNLMIKYPLEPTKLKEFATELFSYMFGKSLAWVNLKPLIDATVKKQSITQEYSRATYEAYRGPKGAFKFDGVMLMNFALQELRYYEEFDDMIKDVYIPQAYIMYQGGGGSSSSRLNLPAFTLKRQAVGAEPPLPQPGEPPQQVNQELSKFAQWYADKQKIGRNAQAVQNITKFLHAEWDANKLKNSKRVLTKLYSNLDNFTAPNPAQEPAQQEPEEQGYTVSGL